LTRLRRLLQTGLEQTQALFEPVRTLFGHVHQVAHVLSNEGGRAAAAVRRDWKAALRRMEQQAAQDEGLAPGLRHFVKVSRSYEPGLFACYRCPELPRTNNDLEQLFGRHRYHERRASGRKVAGPSTVVRGGVKVIASTVTRLEPAQAADLVPREIKDWQELRAQRELRREQRRRQRRFRRSPNAYLKELEEKLRQLSLPS
jgi:hypothetical protein